MMNPKAMKAGTAELFDDKITLVAQRDPAFLSTVLDEVAPAAGDLEILDSDGAELEIDFSQRAPGKLDLAVGQTNDAAVILPAWTLTAHLKYAGLIIESLAQSIPETPSGRWILSALGFSQENIRLADSIVLTGTVDVPADCNALKIRLIEKAPVIGADESMRAVAARGSVAFTDNPANGNTVTLKDGTNTKIFEGDTGAQASGTVTLAAANASSGDTVDLHGKTFEINDGAAAAGSIALEDGSGTPTNATKGDTITLDDGTNPATVLELDSGAFAAGGIQLTDQPADGDTITIDDGVHAASVLELDVGKKATGIITHAANANDGDTVIVTDGTLTKTFEADLGTKPTGIIELTSNDLQGATIEINDGAASETLELDAGTYSTAQIVFIDQPDANCTLEISDGTHTQTFEFDGVGGNINVPIGATALDTMDSLIAAIITSTLTVDAAPGGTGLTRDLTSQLIGAANSITITEAGDTSSHVSTSVVAGIDAGDNVTPGNIGVAIGATAGDTCDNIVTAITGTGLSITAAPGTGDTVDLTHDDYSDTGNVAMVKAGAKSVNITLTGMSGGANPGDAVTPGNIGYAIGATKEATAANFLGAFSTSGLNITAAASAPADEITNLTHNLYSTGGNQTIDVTGAGGRITTTNLTGGLNPGQDITPGNVGVAIGATKEATMANIIAAINAIVADLTITASPSTPADAECTLLSDVVGTAPNGGLSKSGANITITQLAGGKAAGTDITPGNVGVAIGVDADATMVNIIAAINAIVATLTITAAPAAPADHTCTLAADTKDATHNVDIVTTAANIQVTGMAGGLDNGDNVSDPAYIGVALGGTNEATIDNLITALEANLALDNAATVKSAGGAGAFIATIVWGLVGTVGNATVTVVGANLTKTNMTGGLNPGDAITPGNIGFAIGATKIISMANFVAAVEAQRLLGNITLSQQNNGDGTCDLQNDTPGTAGNQTLAKDGANITVTGMTGGLDAFTQRDMYNAMKDINVHIENADIDLEALGELTDPPLAGDTEEGATPRSGISLWKRAVNQLLALKALAATTGVKILPADVTSLKAVTEASAADIKAGVGAPTDAPLAGLTPEDETSRSSVALLKHIANLLISGLFSGANSIATIWNDVWDSVGHAIKVAVSNPPWTRVSGPTALIGAAQGITNVWADLGPEVATSGYNYADVMLTKTPGTSTDISLRALRKDSSGGAIEVPIQWEAVAAGVVTLDDKVWMLNDDATPCLIRIDLRNSVPYLQLQVKDAADGTGTIDTATITLGY